jgi:26S proteasome regulatory subunit (ATPase 3-interacting protein)
MRIRFLFVFSKQVAKLREHLEPLRAGTPLVSTAELNTLDAEWTKWRSEWVKRRKVFYKCARLVFSLLSRVSYGNVPTRRLTLFLCFVLESFWALASDPLSPPDAVQLAEDLGIEYDTPEHLDLERGPLCAPAAHVSKRR